MKAKYIKIINLIVALLVALFCVGQVFAWLADKRYEDDNNFGGSSASPYFAYGDGTAVKKDVNGDAWDPSSGVEWDKKTGPYGLDSYNHLYNLAWLQNTGRFFDSSTQQETQYYFELAGNITLRGDYWLPPIGNDEHPFIGVFDGNGKKIINLHITTDKNKLTAKPVGSSYQFSNAVGLFGNTGETSVIKNFILESPYVEAPAVGDTDVDTSYSSLRNKAIGLAIGHVAGLAQSIGVYAHSETRTFLSASQEYSTFNSILGELAKGKDSSVTGGGHGEGSSGGSGSNFGSSFDVDLLLNRLEKMETNAGSSWKLPDAARGSNEYPVLQYEEKIPFTVTEESTYEGPDAEEVVASNNAGYYTGTQNKINRKQLTFTDKLVNAEGDNPSSNSWTEWAIPGAGSDENTPLKAKKTPKWLYTNTQATVQGGTSYAPASGFRPLTQAEYDDLPEGIKNLIVDDDENPTDNKNDHMTLRFSFQYYLSGTANVPVNITHTDSAWSHFGQISWMGKTYMQGYRNTDGIAVDESGTPYYVDQYNNTAKYNDYKGGVYLPGNALWFKPASSGKIRFVVYADAANETFMLAKVTRKLATRNNPFYIDPNLAEGESDLEAEVIMAQNISSPYCLMYYEHEVTAEEIAAGNTEYFLAGYNNNGAYFVYLDIGASGEVDNDNGEIVEDKISAIDFIYKDVEIAQSAGTGFKVGDFIVGGALYEKSHTSIYFEKIADALTIVYIRLANEGGKNMSISTKSAEVHATYPEYVTGLVE